MSTVLSVCPVAGVAEWVASGDPSALEALYQMINQSVRPYLSYKLRDSETEDLVHEILTIAVEQIRNGELRNPKALGPYLHMIARRRLAALFGARTRRRRMLAPAERTAAPDNPERAFLDRERTDLVQQGLAQLQGRDRELLTRFYFDGQTLGRICADMSLTETQARLFKSRAKAKLAAWARHSSPHRAASGV